jgi:glucosamine-phosphate N-acetyltransferase
MNSEFYTRELNKEDHIDYLNMMFEFTNYKYDLSKNDFEKEVNDMNNNSMKKIIVIIYDEIIIGAGTIFKLNKLHNNPIGQIEDVIIRNEFRGKGLGKLLINKLIDIGLYNFGCYKIILNCLDKNIDFYKKCGFENVGVEMKYIS